MIRKYLVKELPKPMGPGANSPKLGRWNIDYCHEKMNNKIDLSNEDHCGPCGQYALTKHDAEKKKRF
jgi:hypothetical protein